MHIYEHEMKRKWSWFERIGATGMLLLFVAVAVGKIFYGTPKERREEAQAIAVADAKLAIEKRKFAAWFMATQSVEGLLKSPASAEFICNRGPRHSCVVIKDGGATMPDQTQGDLFTVTGKVDSMNLMGVMVRMNFRMQVMEHKGDWYRVSDPKLWD